jgi:UDP-N-acetylmuramoyl-tripeptide--D-alanyl-D-alanine ligase
VRPVAGRLQPVVGLHGSSLFDDSYNANPLSVAAAAEFLASLGGTGFLVLGDMGELGDDGARLHREVGAAARRAGVSHLYATGELSKHVIDEFGDGAYWFATVDELVAALRSAVTAGANILVKGSRFMRMERVVESLTASSQQQESA